MFTFEVTRIKPFAPPELEGEYKLTIKGRKMKMEKLDDGIKARATCNKTDDWNMVDGINTCLGRIQGKKDATEIKVGDKVMVINNDESYSAYADWVVDNVADHAKVARFCYGGDINNGAIGTACCVAPHGKIDRTLVYVQIDDEIGEEKCYLFDVKGLKKI